MYDLEKYLRMNTMEAAVRLEALMEHPVETLVVASRLVVASSMKIYGAGFYRAADGSLYTEAERSLTQWQSCV